MLWSSVYDNDNQGPPLLTWMNFTNIAWIHNHMPSKVWDEVTYLFTYATTEVLEYKYFHPTSYNECNYFSMLVFMSIHVGKFKKGLQVTLNHWGEYVYVYIVGVIHSSLMVSWLHQIAISVRNEIWYYGITLSTSWWMGITTCGVIALRRFICWYIRKQKVDDTLASFHMARWVIWFDATLSSMSSQHGDFWWPDAYAAPRHLQLWCAH